jgi:hypothetical protein
MVKRVALLKAVGLTETNMKFDKQFLPSYWDSNRTPSQAWQRYLISGIDTVSMPES